MNYARVLAGSLLLAAGLVLQGCGSKPARQQKVAAVKQPVPAAPYKQSKNDGAPWWDKDVSGIPDATPMPHYGPVKASPYVVLGKKYYPIQSAHKYRQTGTASWYGTKFHGLQTANGETYDLYGMTAAHKTLPLPSYVKVTNLENGRSVTLRVNDRGPFYSDRIIDLSFAAAKKLGFAEKGVARVSVEGIDPDRWWAQRGQKPPVVGTWQAQPEPALQAGVEEYVPPVQQHAGALLPLEVKPAVDTSGIYLQVGAFANPDAAQLLRDKLSDLTASVVRVSSVAREQQVLHRVRIGPLSGLQQAENIRLQVQQAGLGSPTLLNID
ncbi:MAG: septal ring lytic transglycosylase RlpA family protein [Thiopseudomonas sp.]